VRTNRTIGLSQVQFDELLRRVGELITWDKGVGRPHRLTLAQGLKATLMYFKNNVTEEVIAELLFVSQSVVSETISTLEGVIVEALKDDEPDLAGGLEARVAVIDGSLHPCWSWSGEEDLWSGKHKETGHQHQYVCDLAGNLAYISDPLPGKTHDAKAFRELRLDDHFTESNAFADKGYVGCGVTTPVKKPAGGRLLDWQKEFNKTVNRYRYVIERAIANFKTWRCMHTDYRRPLRTYSTAFRAVRSLHFFKLGFR
jgi:YD repeat-containing protein